MSAAAAAADDDDDEEEDEDNDNEDNEDNDDDDKRLVVVDNDDFEVLRLLTKKWWDANSNSMNSPTFWKNAVEVAVEASIFPPAFPSRDGVSRTSYGARMPVSSP